MLFSDQERRLIALRDSLSGQVLPGSDGSTLYPLRERIGEGGQGWVFRATWNGSVDVVVKVLRPEPDARETLARFQREAGVLRSLSQQPRPNPHIVRFFDHAYATVRVDATGDSWTLPFTVLEYVGGPTLERVLQTESPAGLGIERALRITRHVMLALRDVHAQNIVHRDLKPSNILIDVSGPRELAKVTDFGLAKLIDGFQRTKALAGATIGYAPPEQFEMGNKRVDPRTDVFSLAAIFYELVTGAPAFPFRDDDVPALVLKRILEEARPSLARVADRLPRELQERPDVVGQLDAHLARALSPDPGDRHVSVMVFFDGLDRALSALGGSSSIPRFVFGGAVGPSPAPMSNRNEGLSAAPTLLANDAGELQAPEPARVSFPIASGELQWRVVTPAMWPGPWLNAIAVSPDGQQAVGAGPSGVLRWDGAGWAAGGPLPQIDPSRVRVIAWLGANNTVFAGESPFVVTVVGTGGAWPTRMEGQGLVLHGAAVEPNGSMTFAGERHGEHGPVGVIAELIVARGGTIAPRVTPIAGCGPLYSIVRFDQGLVACGDRGALVLLRADGAGRVLRVCDSPLLKMLALGDGTAVAVGGGGYAFHVWPSLDSQLEPIQTTKELRALARAPDGSVWAGGVQGRILRRDPRGWTRVGVPEQMNCGNVIAMHASDSRVVAFCDGGAVVEGRRG